MVQHVQVSDGRQAVIAGSVKGGGREHRQEGVEGEKWDTPHEPWAGLAEEQQPCGTTHKSIPMWCEDRAGDRLPMSYDAEWTVPPSWRIEYRPEDGGRYRAGRP